MTSKTDADRAFTLATAIARFKPLLAASGMNYATSHTTRIRGFHCYTPGARIERSARWAEPDALYIVGCGDFRADNARRDRAIAACRAAGWTVEDDGRIVAIPPKPPKATP